MYRKSQWLCFISVPGLVNSTSQPIVPGVTFSNQSGTQSPDPPLPPRGVKKPPAALSLSQGSGSSPFAGISSSQVIHSRNTSDPEEKISYILHRRTPSEPPPRPLPLETRNTVNIPDRSESNSTMLTAVVVCNVTVSSGVISASE